MAFCRNLIRQYKETCYLHLKCINSQEFQQLDNYQQDISSYSKNLFSNQMHFWHYQEVFINFQLGWVCNKQFLWRHPAADKMIQKLFLTSGYFAFLCSRHSPTYINKLFYFSKPLFVEVLLKMASPSKHVCPYYWNGLLENIVMFHSCIISSD